MNERKGLFHIYCGDGKGKTTAAVGLAVRSAGAGMRVVFTQFFKDGSSSEIKVLEGLENVRVMRCRTAQGFYGQMSPEQQAQAKCDYSQLLENVLAAAQEADLLVLDEAISACRYGVIDEDRIVEYLRTAPKRLEVVLTGRKPSLRLLELADYVTEMSKVKHPYDIGISARYGIEF